MTGKRNFLVVFFIMQNLTHFYLHSFVILLESICLVFLLSINTNFTFEKHINHSLFMFIQGQRQKQKYPTDKKKVFFFLLHAWRHLHAGRHSLYKHSWRNKRSSTRIKSRHFLSSNHFHLDPLLHKGNLFRNTYIDNNLSRDT